MNNISIYGRLAKDPEIKDYTNNKGESNKLGKFTVAVSRSFGEETDFFDCTIFGKRAEVIAKYFHKGSRIVVSGEMQCQPYEAKEGGKRYPWRLVVRDFDFVDSKKDGLSGAQDGENPKDTFEELDEEVPF